MKLALLFGLLFATQAFAKNDKFLCKASQNYQEIFSLEVTLQKEQAPISLMKTDQFEFFITKKSDSIIELQVLDSFEPSRSYATAKLGESQFVDLAIWKREFLVEARCTLLK